MRKTMMMAIAAAALVLAGDVAVELEAAIRRETVQGDLKGAAEAYRRIAANSGGNREVAARALLRLALVYRKQGDAQARQTLERLVKEYADQKVTVEQARAELAQLSGTATSGTMALRKLWEAEDYSPRSVSRDGRLVAVRHGRTANAGILDLARGTTRMVTQYGNWDMTKGVVQTARISPDGNWVAMGVQLQGAWELRVVRGDGGSAATLYRAQGRGWISTHFWTPDSREVFFSVEKLPPTPTNPPSVKYDLFRVAATGGEPKLVKPDYLGSGGAGQAMALSPDGRWIAFSTPRVRTQIMSVEGGAAQEIGAEEDKGYVVGWSPDGKFLFFVSERTGAAALHRMAMADGRPAGQPEFVMTAPRAAAIVGVDGRGSVYFSDNPAEVNAYVAGLDIEKGAFTREPARLTTRFEGKNAAPVWSPDGSKLAWLGLGEGGSFPKVASIIVRDVASGREKEMPPPVSAELWLSPAWLQPGGSVLLGSMNEKYQHTLHKVDTETGSTTKVKDGLPGGNMVPAWSRDGSKIYRYDFTSRGVRVWDAATNEEKDLFKDPEADVLRHLLPSPDGGEVAYVAHKNPPPGSPEFYGDVQLKVYSMASGRIRSLVKVRPAWMRHPLAWTPDGKHLLYATEWYAGHPDEATKIWIVPAAGGTPKQIGKDFRGRVFDLTVSPDGKQLGFDVTTHRTELWALETPAPGRK